MASSLSPFQQTINTTVGITRAKRDIRISHVANRNLFGKWTSALPSRFLKELPGENVIRASEIVYGSDSETTKMTLDGSDRPRFGHRHSNWGKYTTFSEKQPRFTETPPEPQPGSLDVGIRIFHQKFGYGKILDVDGNKLEVSFEKAGIKKVLANYVEPA